MNFNVVFVLFEPSSLITKKLPTNLRTINLSKEKTG